MNNKTFLVFTATFTLCVIFTSDMQAAYAGQSDVDAGLPYRPSACSLHAGSMSIVKYALNEHANSRRILPLSYPPPSSFNQSNVQRVLISEAH